VTFSEAFVTGAGFSLGVLAVFFGVVLFLGLLIGGSRK